MYEKILREKKISVTKQRIAILGFLGGIKKPVTIDDLKKEKSLGMDQATLYRSLSLLVKKGLVYQTDFREGASFYEFQLDSHHHHLVCLECKGKTGIDFCPAIPEKKILKENNFQVEHHMFEIFGLCKSCLVKS